MNLEQWLCEWLHISELWDAFPRGCNIDYARRFFDSFYEARESYEKQLWKLILVEKSDAVALKKAARLERQREQLAEEQSRLLMPIIKRCRVKRKHWQDARRVIIDRVMRYKSSQLDTFRET